MGFFSKLCSKTHLPVLCERPGNEELLRLSTVVVLTPTGARFDHVYEGYGIPGVDWESVKLVLKDAYAGESYDDLPLAPADDLQGFFQSAELSQLLAQLPALPSPQAYGQLCAEEGPAFVAAWEKAAQVVGITLDAESAPHHARGENQPKSVRRAQAQRLATLFSMLLEGTESRADSRWWQRYQYTLRRCPNLAKQLPADMEDGRALALQFEDVVHKEVASRLRKAAQPYLSSALS